MLNIYVKLLTPVGILDMDYVEELASKFPEFTEEGTVINEDFLMASMNIPGVINMIPMVNGVKAGFFQLAPFNAISSIIHPLVDPNFRMCTDEIMDCVTGYIQYHSRTTRKLQGFVPDTNKPALNFFIRNGFEVEGTLKNSMMREGILHNQVIVGKEI